MKKLTWINKLFGQTQTQSSAQIAKDRLTVLVASGQHRLAQHLTEDMIDRMKCEILDVVNRYVAGVSADDVEIRKDKGDSEDGNIDILTMFINLPEKK